MASAALAKRPDLPAVRAHRLIARAVGRVKVTIDGDSVECLGLESRLAARHGLTRCEVAPDLEETAIPFRALSLTREIGQRETPVIGPGHGAGASGLAVLQGHIVVG